MAKKLIPGSDAVVINPDGIIAIKPVPNREIEKAGLFHGLTKITVSMTAPTNPDVGDLWLDTS